MQKVSTASVRAIKRAGKPIQQIGTKVAVVRGGQSMRKTPQTIKGKQAVPIAKTIGEEFDEIISTIPDEIIESLPTDGAERHDFYLYQAH